MLLLNNDNNNQCNPLCECDGRRWCFIFMEQSFVNASTILLPAFYILILFKCTPGHRDAIRRVSSRQRRNPEDNIDSNKAKRELSDEVKELTEKKGKENSTKVERSKVKTIKSGDTSDETKRTEDEVVEGTATDSSVESTAVKEESMERTAAAGDEETRKTVKPKGLDRSIKFKKKGMDQTKKARGGFRDLADDSACVDDPYMYNEQLRGKTSILSLDLAALNGFVRMPNEMTQCSVITTKKEKKNENLPSKSPMWRRKNIGIREKTTTSQYGTIIDKKGRKNDKITRSSRRKKKVLGTQEKTQHSLSFEEFSRKVKKKGHDMDRKCDAQKGILKDGETAAVTRRTSLNDFKMSAENDRENYGKYSRIDGVIKKDVGRNEEVQQRNENKDRKADQIIESVRFEPR